MKLIVDRSTLVKQMKLLARGELKAEKYCRLWACDARVFVGISSTIAGTEALVLEDGGCTLPRVMFLKLLQSYKGKANITIEANENGVKIENTTLPVYDYSSAVEPPATFHVFPVTDEWIAHKTATTLSPPA